MGQEGIGVFITYFTSKTLVRGTVRGTQTTAVVAPLYLLYLVLTFQAYDVSAKQYRYESDS